MIRLRSGRRNAELSTSPIPAHNISNQDTTFDPQSSSRCVVDCSDDYPASFACRRWRISISAQAPRQHTPQSNPAYAPNGLAPQALTSPVKITCINCSEAVRRRTSQLLYSVVAMSSPELRSSHLALLAVRSLQSTAGSTYHVYWIYTRHHFLCEWLLSRFKCSTSTSALQARLNSHSNFTHPYATLYPRGDKTVTCSVAQRPLLNFSRISDG